MTKLRSILGLIAGTLMILSAGMHSFLGWKALSAELAKAQVPAELTAALAAGWTFGGAAMLAFGCIVIALFVRRLKGEAVALWPAIVIGTTYVAFGAWALAANNFDPFFLVFVIPGTLLLVASISKRAA